jgi:hypothetical protein
MKNAMSILTRQNAFPVSSAEPESPKSYLSIAILMTVIVIAGFWSPYFAPLVRGAAARPWIIHLHAAVFIGWMALLFAQIVFVYLGRIQLHRTIGNFGIAYGFLVVVTGVIVAFAAPILHLKSGEWQMERAAGFLLISLRAITLFGGFFAASIAYKRKPEIHKRLILLATIALLFAPAGRMINPAHAPLLFFILWLSPVLITIWRDAIAVRRIHPVFIVGLVVLLAGLTPVLISESEGYLDLGRSLLSIF